MIEALLGTVTAAASLWRILSFLDADNKRADTRLFRRSHVMRPDEEDEELLLDHVRLQDITTNFAPADIIRLSRAGAGWDSKMPLTFEGVTFEVPWPSITAVIGPVGCGKSTLLHMILGEAPCVTGSVFIPAPRAGYCSQIPWLTNESIKDNIVGPEDFDEIWYNTIIRATALQEDFNRMALGQDMVIGNEGCNLSGGQKKRIVEDTLFHQTVDNPLTSLPGSCTSDICQSATPHLGRSLQRSGQPNRGNGAGSNTWAARPG